MDADVVLKPYYLNPRGQRARAEPPKALRYRHLRLGACMVHMGDNNVFLGRQAHGKEVHCIVC